MSKHLFCSVVITHYQNQQILDHCLSNLLRFVPTGGLEVLVVNDNPFNRINENSWPRNVRIINNEFNLGYSGACNLGASQAAGDYLIFMDSDILITETTFNPLLKAIVHEPDVAAVGPKIIKLSTGRIETFGLAYHEVDVIKPLRGAVSDIDFACKDRFFQTIPSGLLVIRKSLFERHGGFDEKMYNCYGDLDLSCKLVASGGKLKACATAIAYHRGTVSGTARYAYHSDAKAIFFRKWGSILKNDGIGFIRKIVASQRSKLGLLAKEYLVLNFSLSAFSADYIEAIIEEIEADVIDIYNIKPKFPDESTILLHDHIPANSIIQNVPLLIFSDDYSNLKSNFIWFAGRIKNNDLIADKNGNLIPVQQLGSSN